MKPALVFIFILMSVAGVWILTHSLTSDPKTTFASNSTIFPSSSPILTLIQSSTSTVQLLKATYGPPDGFLPYQFTVKSGVPARLEVTATEDGIGCMGSLMVPDFSTQVEFFEKGKTSIIDFIPTTPGTYYITCGMGIPHATIFVK